MNSKQVIFGLATTAIFSGVIYFGFFKKDADGLTIYQKLFTKADEEIAKIDRAVAIAIIEKFSNGTKVPVTYDDNYLIARAKAIILKQTYFYLGSNKYNTLTGKQVAN